MSRVVCLGDLMLDVVAMLPGPLAVGSDTPAPIALHGGGAAANTAAWLAAVGVPVTFAGRVGDDSAGRQACADLESGGVRLSVSIDPVRPTGMCVVLVGPSGERTMIPDAGANSGLNEAPFGELLVGAQDWLYVSGYALLNDGARGHALAVMGAARVLGARIAVDAASAAPLRSFGAEAFLETVGLSLLLANRPEAEVLTGLTDPAAAVRALAVRTGEAIVKDGAGGSWWSDGKDVVSAPAIAVGVIDSTGAGDAYAAGFLAARISGSGVDDGLRAATELATRAITQVGARPAVVGNGQV